MTPSITPNKTTSLNVFYSICVADPWIQVAKKLEQEQGWKPVYWNGYHDDGSREKVAEVFPDAIYQGYHASWKGIFPSEVEARYFEGALDIDLLNAMAPYELQAIRMMDRMDPDRNSFNFMERQRHFRNLLRYWLGCLRWLKPGVVVSAIVPHRVFDYVLYLLCRHEGIPYLCFRGSVFRGRSFPLTDIFSMGNILDDAIVRHLDSDCTTDELRQKLPKDVLAKLDDLRKDYAEAEPVYMKQNVQKHAKSASLTGLTKKMVNDFRTSSDLYLGEHGFLKNGMSYLVERDVEPENSKLSVASYARLKLKNNKYKNELKAYYESLTTAPDFSKKYVVLNLHYQPEMTSNPSGDVFADQMLCVDVLSRHLPDDWLIYVKEHRSQFYAHAEGHTSRIRGMYTDMAKFPNVRLLPLKTDPFVAIKNANAVATITGTSGWEAMAMGKPVVLFGMSWYEKFTGVLRISDEKSASKLVDFISKYQFNERDLMAYLNAYCDESMYAYQYPKFKEFLDMDEETCIQNISAMLQKMLTHAHAAH